MRSARIAGISIGLLALVTFLLATRPAPRPPTMGASLDLALVAPGEVEVNPPAPVPVLTADGLRAGGPSDQGTARLRNRTAGPVTIALDLEQRSLDELGRLAPYLSLAVELAGRRVFEGSATELAGGPPLAALAADRAVPLRLTAWIPVGAGPGYAGEEADVSLRLLAIPAGPGPAGGGG